MLHLVLSPMLAVGQPQTVLHFAPEKPIYDWTRRVSGDASFTYVDVDPEVYPFAEVQSADITDLPFEDGVFDLILCSHVMEHVPDDVTAFSELMRVLRPNGVAVMLVPLLYDGGEPIEDPDVTEPKDRQRVFGQNDHVRVYTPDLFVTRALQGGAQVEVVDPFEHDPMRAAAYGVCEGSKVFLCRPG